MSRFRLTLILVLALSLLTALYVGYKRTQIEARSSRVEIALDWSDFQALARSYDYDQTAFLIALRRAGLTSLAVSEELGGAVNGDREAYLSGGAALIDQARIGGIADPLLAGMLKRNAISSDEVYLTVFNAAARERYLRQLRLHFDSKSVRVLRYRLPSLIAVRTQLDYASALGLGLPEEPLAQARKLGFLLVPRLQNDERFGASQIAAEFHDVLAHERVSTMIFFGLRNEVLGFPRHVADTADAFRRTHINYGSIETYEATQVQRGDEELARQTIGQTVRVQAIARAEQEKLSFNAIVARYLLGARERNIRVLYVRPVLHQEGALSLQATNVELIRRLAEGLAARDLQSGRATPIPGFRVGSRLHPLVIGLVTLGVPALFLLLLDLIGRPASRALALAAFAGDLALYALGVLAGQELIACKIIALLGAIEFAILAVMVTIPVFTGPTPRTTLDALLAGLRVLALSTGTALGGALLVIGLLSTPLMMTEVERFTGVKAILLLPPLVVLAIYLFTRAFGQEEVPIGKVAVAPVKVYQLLVAGGLLVAGVLYLARSGNQSEIAPSAFELLLRSQLSALLGVRPRFKEFLIGFPAMMLLPALRLVDRRRLGWLFALAIGMGAADEIDTFSHLHTALSVSLLRLVNGVVIGAMLGAAATCIYRARVKASLTE
jgi:hypothetical protein